jgi:hypothetical protein
LPVAATRERHNTSNNIESRDVGGNEGRYAWLAIADRIRRCNLYDGRPLHAIRLRLVPSCPQPRIASLAWLACASVLAEASSVAPFSSPCNDFEIALAVLHG